MTNRRTVRFYQADVFTDTVFGGNPVAVIPEADGLDVWEMQKIAREMNLSRPTVRKTTLKPCSVSAGLVDEPVIIGMPAWL